MKNNDKINSNENVRMSIFFDLQEIKAETFLSLENLSDFSVQTKESSGTFYRNYSPDLIKYDRNSNTVTLSRDGIYNLLPEELFFEEDELKNSKSFKETTEKRKEKKKQINCFFQPFDTEYFKLSFTLEKQINTLSQKSNSVLLDLFLGPVVEADVLFLQSLLPHISQIKGNDYLIIDILKMMLKSPKIELKEADNDCKCFIIHIPNLSKEKYIQKIQQICGIFEILREYFLPFNTNYDFKIKDRQQKFVLGENLILDYNTNIV